MYRVEFISFEDTYVVYVSASSIRGVLEYINKHELERVGNPYFYGMKIMEVNLK